MLEGRQGKSHSAWAAVLSVFQRQGAENILIFNRSEVDLPDLPKNYHNEIMAKRFGFYDFRNWNKNDLISNQILPIKMFDLTSITITKAETSIYGNRNWESSHLIHPVLSINRIPIFLPLTLTASLTHFVSINTKCTNIGLTPTVKIISWALEYGIKCRSNHNSINTISINYHSIS